MRRVQRVAFGPRLEHVYCIPRNLLVAVAEAYGNRYDLHFSARLLLIEGLKHVHVGRLCHILKKIIINPDIITPKHIVQYNLVTNQFNTAV